MCGTGRVSMPHINKEFDFIFILFNSITEIIDKKKENKL